MWKLLLKASHIHSLVFFLPDCRPMCVFCQPTSNEPSQTKLNRTKGKSSQLSAITSTVFRCFYIFFPSFCCSVHKHFCCNRWLKELSTCANETLYVQNKEKVGEHEFVKEVEKFEKSVK